MPIMKAPTVWINVEKYISQWTSSGEEKGGSGSRVARDSGHK